MPTLQEFAQNFDGKPVPAKLARLLEFQEEAGFENYSWGFGLYQDDKSGLHHGWSTEAAFKDKLMPFAQANGSGSFYALWQYDDSKSTDELPVVLFGDEGGEFIVAENIDGLLQLLTIDAEPSTYEEVSYFKDEDDYDPSEYADDYKAWLQEHFSLSAVEDEKQIIEAAQQKFQAAFDSWKQPFMQY